MFSVDENCQYADWISVATKDCSGHGTCDGAGRCKCVSDYSGKSDWVNMDGYDCHVSIPNENFSIPWFGSLVCTSISFGFVTAVLIRDLKKVKYDWPKLRKLKVRGGGGLVISAQHPATFPHSAFLRRLSPSSRF
jgi:hypothetical protein